MCLAGGSNIPSRELRFTSKIKGCKVSNGCKNTSFTNFRAPQPFNQINPINY